MLYFLSIKAVGTSVALRLYNTTMVNDLNEPSFGRAVSPDKKNSNQTQLPQPTKHGIARNMSGDTGRRSCFLVLQSADAVRLFDVLIRNTPNAGPQSSKNIHATIQYPQHILPNETNADPSRPHPNKALVITNHS